MGGNEAADQVAKDALNEEIGNQEPYPLPTSEPDEIEPDKKDGKEVKTI
jgi:hypothetical protein